jgi:hypothetical protein
MKRRILSIKGAWLVLLALVWPVRAVEVTLQVENLSPEGGVYLSPTWVGFDGPQIRRILNWFASRWGGAAPNPPARLHFPGGPDVVNSLTGSSILHGEP